MFELVATEVMRPLPALLQAHSFLFCFIFIPFLAPILTQTITRYPYFLEKSYRAEAESIAQEPPPSEQLKNHPKWLLPISTVIVYLLIAFAFIHITTIAQAMAVLFLGCYISIQFFVNLNTDIVLDELNSLALWAGLAFSLFNTLIPAQEALLGAVACYSVLWCISKIPLPAINRIAVLMDPKFSAVFGAWLGLSMAPIAIFIGIGISGALLFLQILFNKLTASNPRLTIPTLPTSIGLLASLWYFSFIA